MLDTARISSKGQITIPKEIRSKLGLREGGKVIFIEKNGDILLKNASMIALMELQDEMSGVAEKIGWKDEEDVIKYRKEIRHELGVERGYID
ncbi:MAG: AbrB/MazE/SpoVT family DNA-binding domain-containing protein [Ruminococcus sp.]|jgi:AbrB family looped-hinge helix DNA binding protein|nr:AbrB/MazE/SpoVT family DNA-binding domain-containing protein [Ruminococcus sp.]